MGLVSMFKCISTVIAGIKLDFKNTDLSLYLLSGWLRGFIADYGVPLMVLVWTTVSYIPARSVPEGIPRRLFSPNPWSQGTYENWTVIKAWVPVSLDVTFY